ncbi:hypothetical protein PROFUN_12760 [Planoprotostelium fungivorum]|uniref:Ribosome biogenesis protein NOP53 n=1 Tax=Planoprotostelium fungivorum TaxID=1890364 RepID=A0A2P6N5J5_9EUKA|nr:hypothetical protein PROFUN_12760 [Planoprotostelium fungivorum]
MVNIQKKRRDKRRNRASNKRNRVDEEDIISMIAQPHLKTAEELENENLFIIDGKSEALPTRKEYHRSKTLRADKLMQHNPLIKDVKGPSYGKTPAGHLPEAQVNKVLNAMQNPPKPRHVPKDTRQAGTYDLWDDDAVQYAAVQVIEGNEKRTEVVDIKKNGFLSSVQKWTKARSSKPIVLEKALPDAGLSYNPDESQHHEKLMEEVATVVKLRNLRHKLEKAVPDDIRRSVHAIPYHDDIGRSRKIPHISSESEREWKKNYRSNKTSRNDAMQGMDVIDSDEESGSEEQDEEEEDEEEEEEESKEDVKEDIEIKMEDENGAIEGKQPEKTKSKRIRKIEEQIQFYKIRFGEVNGKHPMQKKLEKVLHVLSIRREQKKKQKEKKKQWKLVENLPTMYEEKVERKKKKEEEEKNKEHKSRTEIALEKRFRHEPEPYLLKEDLPSSLRTMPRMNPFQAHISDMKRRNVLPAGRKKRAATLHKSQTHKLVEKFSEGPGKTGSMLPRSSWMPEE